MTHPVTPEQLAKDPTILLTTKFSSESATSAIQHFDGLVGAVVFEGHHFVTSPNVDHIYAPPRSKRMTFKKDYRLGEHDQLLWPQPYLEPQCHLACIPRRVEVYDESSRPIFRILFHPVSARDFLPLEGGPISGLGFLSGAIIASLKKLARFLETQLETLDAIIAASTPILKDLFVFIRRTLISLESLPMTRRQALFLFAEIQRYMLEYSAAYRYLTIYKPRMLNVVPPSTAVEDLVGSFVFNLADADNFVRAGIPVWLIRPAALAGTVRVHKLVKLIDPGDRLCLVDAYDTYPVFYEGPPVNIDKYKTFARYSCTFLSYHNPFRSISSTPSTSVVNVFAAPGSSSQQGSRGVERPQHHLSSGRYTPYHSNRPKKPPGSAGRNKFEEPSSPLFPPTTAAWSDALKNVVVSPLKKPLLNADERGYVFPDPGLFLGVTTPERQAKFFYNWLKYRPALIYRLSGRDLDSKPLSTQMWRTLLQLPIDEPQQAVSSVPVRAASTSSSLPQKQTKSAKRLEIIHSLLQNCLNIDGVEVNESPTNEIFWQGEKLIAGELPNQQVAQEILWELAELNFCFEFMALDSKAHTPAVPVSRDDLLLRCFPGKVGGSILIAQREFAHQGLAASCWKERAPYVVAVKNIMRAWPGFDKVREGCKGVDLDKDGDVGGYSQGEVEAMEVAVAGFYTQTFYDFFGRAATIPRRLQPKATLE